MCQRLRIDSLSSEGEGIGSLEGLKVFVEGALPGEEVEIVELDLKRNFAKASLLRVVTSSPERVSPPCPLFATCGGCQVMHASYEEQLRLKRERVVWALRKFAHLDLPVEPCRPSPSPFYYRNKIQLPVMNGQMGLYKRHSHDIVPIDECFIQNALGEKVLKGLKPLLFEGIKTVVIRTSERTGEALVIVVTNGETPPEWGERVISQIPEVKGVIENIHLTESNVVLGPTWRPLAGPPFLYEELLGKRFKISPGAFFQVNTEQAERLFSDALTLAQITPENIVWDAFCGVGVLALLAANRAQHVFGTEVVSSAISDAKENALLNHITNATFRTAAAEEAANSISPDVVFLNPPRKGCDAKLLHSLKAPRLIYISCDPATLARDLKLLSSHYTIETIRPFDMFPQTAHVETLAALKIS